MVYVGKERKFFLKMEEENVVEVSERKSVVVRESIYIGGEEFRYIHKK